MKIGDEVFVHGYIDEIRKDTVIIRNNGGYFGTIPSEVIMGELPLKKMIRFEIVPFKEFEKSAKKCGLNKDEILEAYSNIKIPTRSTKGSAGYDFYMPFEIELEYFEDKYIPTGIRCHMDDDVCLLLVPKSGLGCKYGMGMENTIGVIDSDYYHADNYGQIHAMMKSKYPLTIKQGQKFMQGIFINYLKTDNDNADRKRTGGFGSTGDFDCL